MLDHRAALLLLLLALPVAAQQPPPRPEPAKRVLRVHDVRDLLEGVADRPAPAFRRLPEDVQPRAIGSFAFDAADAPEGRALDPDRLVDLVRQNVDEDGWHNERNAIEVRGEALVVVQTPAIQAEVEAYLERLRALRGRVVTVDVTLVAVEGALARGLLAAGGPLGVEQARDLEARLAAGRGALILERQRLSAWDRQQVHAATRRDAPFVRWQVNQTGVVPTMESLADHGDEGVVAEVRPALVGASGALLLDLDVAAARWSRREAPVHLGPIGPGGTLPEATPLHLPRARAFGLRGRLLVRDGALTIAGGARAHAAAGLAAGPAAPSGLADPYLLVLVRPSLAALQTGQAGTAPASGPVLRLHDVSLITVEGRRAGDDGLRAGGLDVETVMQLVTRNVAPESWSGGRTIEAGEEGLVAVVQTPEVQAQVEELLATLRRAHGRGLFVELVRLTLPADERAKLLAGGGPAVPLAAVDALVAADPSRVSGWLGAAAWDGQRVVVDDLTQVTYVAGIPQSSGGTGDVVAVLHHPDLATYSVGQRAAFRARVAPDGQHVAVALEGWLHEGALEPSAAPTPPGPVELPDVTRRGLALELTFRLDHALVVGDGPELVLLRVRARDLLER